MWKKLTVEIFFTMIDLNLMPQKSKTITENVPQISENINKVNLSLNHAIRFITYQQIDTYIFHQTSNYLSIFIL